MFPKSKSVTAKVGRHLRSVNLKAVLSGQSTVHVFRHVFCVFLFVHVHGTGGDPLPFIIATDAKANTTSAADTERDHDINKTTTSTSTRKRREHIMANTSDPTTTTSTRQQQSASTRQQLATTRHQQDNNPTTATRRDHNTRNIQRQVPLPCG